MGTNGFDGDTVVVAVLVRVAMTLDRAELDVVSRAKPLGRAAGQTVGRLDGQEDFHCEA